MSKQKASNSPKKSSEAKAPNAQEVDLIAGPIKAVFRDHRWPAHKQALIEEARLHTWLDKEHMDRLQKIPEREYGSMAELVEAVRAVAGKPAGDRAETLDAELA